jgi:hypothetical protein
VTEIEEGNVHDTECNSSMYAFIELWQRYIHYLFRELGIRMFEDFVPTSMLVEAALICDTLRVKT